jgi:hypothetical protein
MRNRVDCRIGSERRQTVPGKNNSSKRFSPHPADYPLGSPASRVAARAMLEWKHKTREYMQLMSLHPIHRTDTSRVQFGEWKEWPNGTLVRWLYVPHVWLKTPVEEVPRCPDCGARL